MKDLKLGVAPMVRCVTSDLATLVANAKRYESLAGKGIRSVSDAFAGDLPFGLIEQESPNRKPPCAIHAKEALSLEGHEIALPSIC